MDLYLSHFGESAELLEKERTIAFAWRPVKDSQSLTDMLNIESAMLQSLHFTFASSCENQVVPARERKRVREKRMKERWREKPQKSIFSASSRLINRQSSRH